MGRPWLPNLSSNVDIRNPFELFRPSFTDEIIDKLVEWINKHAELYPLYKEAEQPRTYMQAGTLRALQSVYSYKNYYRAGYQRLLEGFKHTWQPHIPEYGHQI